jgi:putative Ca2+/H+ antiporter (TMEM165/GDT1 family)
LSLEAFAVSTGVVALGEMGDKTQLLALLLVARWRQPWTIAAGILVATLANHAGAAALGSAISTLVTRWLSPEVMRWILGISFIAVALWMLKPDDAGEEVEGAGTGRWGVFGLTVIAFFLAEMGDKTQIATVMLAARFDAPLVVTAGTTLGMMLANAPALWLGDALLKRVPIAWVHRVAAVVFLGLGVAVLLGLPG